MKISVVIPAYNEEKTIGKVIEDCKKYADEVIVVDDNSNDNTYSEALKYGVTVLKHRINLGKGAALRTGCDAAVLRNADTIITLDADGQHDPNEIPFFIEKLKDNEIVFSKRVKRKDMPLSAIMGNLFLSNTMKLLFNIKIDDAQCGYRAFTKEAYPKILWNTRGYSIENEIIARVATNKLKYSEVPIKTIYHDKYKGTSVVDGLSIFLDILILRVTTWF